MATFESMRKKHRKDSVFALSFFIFLILIYVFHAQYISALQDLINDPTKLADVLKNAWFIVILTLVSPFVSYFVGIFTIAKRDFYYDIDNLTLKTREQVDRQICRKMLDLRGSLNLDDQKKLTKLKRRINSDEVCRKIMRIFFHFIEKRNIVNPQLKSHAFTYWGDYFSSLMYAFWGVFAILGTIIIYLFDNSISVLRIIIFSILIVTVGLNFYSMLKGRTRKRLFSIPDTQIEEIHRNASEQLLRTLKEENFFQ